jgi:hypothetical protein
MVCESKTQHQSMMRRKHLGSVVLGSKRVVSENEIGGAGNERSGESVDLEGGGGALELGG